MMPTALLLCGFPAFDGRCQAAYIPLATAKLTLSPLIPNPSPKIFSYSFKGSAPKNPHKEPKMLYHQPVGMHPGASAGVNGQTC